MNEIATTTNNQLINWDDATKLEEIRKLFAPTLTEMEFQFFVGLGKASGLNPFTREIWAVKYDKNAPAQVFIGRDGYRKAAQAHSEYDFHQSDAVYANDGFTVVNGEVEHKYTLTDRGKLVGAYCIAKRHKSSRPMYVFVDVSEYSTGRSVWKDKPATMIKKCFDSETEILTDQGFQRFDSVTANVLQINKENGLEITDSIPFYQEYSGEMIQYDGQYLNFSVTPNHNMVTTEHNIEAGDLFNQASKCYRDAKQIPSNFEINKKDYDLISDDQIKLAAYFICDGSHTGFRQFRVAVSREYKVTELELLNMHSNLTIKKAKGNVSKTNGRHIETNKDYQCYTFDFSLIDEICFKDKTLNTSVLFNLSQRQAKILMDSLILFDGSVSNTNTKRFYTSRLDILKQTELVAVLAGYAISTPTIRYSDISTKPSYFLTISNKKYYSVVSYMKKKQGIKKIPVNMSNKVWCVTVPSGMIVVRRNGFSMVCGNCAESQCLRAAFQDLLGGTYDEAEMIDRSSEIIKPRAVDQLKSLIESKKAIKTLSNSFQHDDINNLIHERGFTAQRLEKALNHYKADSLYFLSEEDANDFIAILQKEPFAAIDPETGEVIQ